MRKLLVLILILPSTVFGNIEEAQARSNCVDARNAIKFYRSTTWEWQARHDGGRTPTDYADRYAKGCSYLRWTAGLWKDRSSAARAQFEEWFKAIYSKWECIHGGEGPWNANTGNGYHGGLQMDYTFQKLYGREFLARWGYAGNWPIWAQLLTAERAFRTRSFYPWPNTAHYCGLI